MSEECLGCSREDIGTHSNRKFSESTAASRIDGPNRTQVCLRAGQSVGKTQDCYMTSEEDGDALVGRTVAQLKFTADEFDVLPLHFDNDTLSNIGRIGWSRFVPDYEMYPKRFATEVIPKLLASVVFHYERGDIAKIYPRDHPIFFHRIFTDYTVFGIVKGKAILAFEQCDKGNMYATGVPAVITVSREIRRFKQSYEKTKDDFEKKLNTLQIKLCNVVEETPTKVVEAMLERFNVEGVIPVTRADIHTCINEALREADGPFRQLCDRLDQMSSRFDVCADQKCC